jgi:hypothetical protein
VGGIPKVSVLPALPTKPDLIKNYSNARCVAMALTITELEKRNE